MPITSTASTSHGHHVVPSSPSSVPATTVVSGAAGSVTGTVAEPITVTPVIGTVSAFVLRKLISVVPTSEGEPTTASTSQRTLCAVTALKR